MTEENLQNLQWIPTLLFEVMKWELFCGEEKLGWVIETTTIGGDTIWCALDNRGSSPIKPMIYRGEIGDCARALISLIKEQDHEHNI